MAKTKTEELQREIVDILARAEPNTCGAIATRILKACKDAGLAFVAKDAKLPKLPLATGVPFVRPCCKKTQEDMLKAGYRQIEEIESNR